MHTIFFGNNANQVLIFIQNRTTGYACINQLVNNFKNILVGPKSNYVFDHKIFNSDWFTHFSSFQY